MATNAAAYGKGLRHILLPNTRPQLQREAPGRKDWIEILERVLAEAL